MKRLVYWTLGLFIISASALGLALPAGAADDLDIHQISRRLDELYRSKTSQGEMTMTVVTPHYRRELKMKIWSRGMDDTLVRILSPRKERGNASLKKGNEMWNYIVKIKKTTRIPPSLMMGSWMGSDFTNDDIVKETTWETDYFIKRHPQPPAGLIGLVYTPKPQAPVTWSRVIAWLDAQSLLPVRMEYFDEKDRKVRLMEFSQVQDLGGKRIPVKLVLTPLTEDKKGRQTIIEYTHMEFDLKLPPNLFSLSNLRRER